MTELTQLQQWLSCLSICDPRLLQEPTEDPTNPDQQRPRDHASRQEQVKTMSLYEAITQTRGGQRHLAKARLRYRVLSLLHEALAKSGLNQTELAEAAEVGKSAVSQAFAGNGNLRVDTVAAYLDALGFELGLRLEPAGTARADATPST
ncbi:MAG: helix-turn-helix domain-containing protein [Propionicimonas sp.]|nr:helix-turn-helix domain-containing protein [Propionicimonas sp.]